MTGSVTYTEPKAEIDSIKDSPFDYNFVETSESSNEHDWRLVVHEDFSSAEEGEWEHVLHEGVETSLETGSIRHCSDGNRFLGGHCRLGEVRQL